MTILMNLLGLVLRCLGVVIGQEGSVRLGGAVRGLGMLGDCYLALTGTSASADGGCTCAVARSDSVDGSHRLWLVRGGRRLAHGHYCGREREGRDTRVAPCRGGQFIHIDFCGWLTLASRFFGATTACTPCRLATPGSGAHNDKFAVAGGSHCQWPVVCCW